MIQINIVGLTKLELNFGKVERVDIHEETKNDTKERVLVLFWEILGIYGMLHDMMFND